MAEQTYELKPVGVRYVCDACGKGEMQHVGGAVLMSLPPKYRHICTHCGREQHFTKLYPEVRWLPLPAAASLDSIAEQLLENSGLTR